MWHNTHVYVQLCCLAVPSGRIQLFTLLMRSLLSFINGTRWHTNHDSVACLNLQYVSTKRVLNVWLIAVSNDFIVWFPSCRFMHHCSETNCIVVSAFHHRVKIPTLFFLCPPFSTCQIWFFLLATHLWTSTPLVTTRAAWRTGSRQTGVKLSV